MEYNEGQRVKFRDFYTGKIKTGVIRSIWREDDFGGADIAYEFTGFTGTSCLIYCGEIGEDDIAIDSQVPYRNIIELIKS